MMSLTLSWSHLARKTRRHSLASTRPLSVTVCETSQSAHRVWGLVCHLFNSETPLLRGLQQGVRQERDDCAHWGAVLSFSLSSASCKASSPANYEQCHPSLLLSVYFFPSSVGRDGHFFCRGMRGLRPMLRPRLSFSSD